MPGLLEFSQNNRWMLRSHSFTSFIPLWFEIVNVELPANDISDSIIWKVNSFGNYASESGWNLVGSKRDSVTRKGLIWYSSYIQIQTICACKSMNGRHLICGYQLSQDLGLEFSI